MPPHFAPGSERLDELLFWLDENRDRATAAYLDLRSALVKIFTWNHCSDAEGLTDEVFDRVARKLPGLKDSFKGDPKLYFYGVANNLIKEHRKTARVHVPLDGVQVGSDDAQSAYEETREMRGDCLERCLQQLSPEKRDLILSYYSREKREKIIHRAEMARQLGISGKTLRVRMLRIRTTLEDCIERCLDQRQKSG
jgi:RNA polymerase sigma factor (sigma-70 family)